jgi:hypothetical protein
MAFGRSFSLAKLTRVACSIHLFDAHLTAYLQSNVSSGHDVMEGGQLNRWFKLIEPVSALVSESAVNLGSSGVCTRHETESLESLFVPVQWHR